MKKKELTPYETAVKDLRREHKREREALAEARPLMEIAEEYAEKFSPNHTRNNEERFSRVGYDSFICHAATLDLYLGKEDNASCTDPIIDAIIKDPRLELKDVPEKILENSTMAVWEFAPKGSSTYRPYLKVRVHYEQSESCKLVGTGRFLEPKEIEIMVCS